MSTLPPSQSNFQIRGGISKPMLSAIGQSARYRPHSDQVAKS